ncbi:hypothetical protein [Stenotrophomonas sp. PS02289]|uniref:hypothetical protein n=1 Tax=Stenotrophomonas sp. PS02289 TaxID=2991422 RepID=UPI00249B87B4|nr:hypothetical protein [Stenotrophomonas sp. PS02289]
MSESNTANTNPSLVEPVDACEAVAPPSESRLRLFELAAQLATNSERKSALRSKVDKMSRARQAAEGDAQAARQQWSAKLRDSDGTLTRDIQKLRANERSAMSLAEEYRAMEAEIASELPRLDLELAEAASLCIAAQKQVFLEAAELGYAELLAGFEDRLAVAFSLFEKAENVGAAQKASSDELASRFFFRLGSAVRKRLADVAVTDQVAERLALPPMDMSSVDMQLVNSTIRRTILRKELEAGSQA